MQINNLFADALIPKENERFDMLLRHKNLVVERIVSSSRIQPQEYVQSQDEWVLLIRGDAELKVDGKSIALKEGDYLFLPAGVPHQVERTSEGAMWLVVHLHPEQPDAALVTPS